MYEIYERHATGWTPVDCTCAAGRAAFRDEHSAHEALSTHLTSCYGNAGAPPNGAFRLFPTDAG